MNELHSSQSTGIPRSWLIIPAIAGLIVLLFSSHRQHVLDYLPFLLLLACPLMHMFMHGKHSHGGGHAGHQIDASAEGAGRKTDERS